MLPDVELPGFVYYGIAILTGVLAVCVTCPLWWVVGLDSTAGDETLLPLPAGLHVVDDEPLCGTQSCARSVTITGDRADARMRAHLASRGFRLRADHAWEQQFSATAAHDTGVLIPHHVWLGYKVDGASVVTIIWDVDPVLDL